MTVATLSVEGVPDLLVARLAAAAAASGRCVKSELIVVLARGLSPALPCPAACGPECRCPGVAHRASREGWGGPAT